MRTLTLGDYAQTTSGSTPARGKKDYWQPAEIPWVKTAEVTFRSITSAEESISKIALAECSLTLLPPNTVLVAMYGQGKTRGQSAILEISATINQACFAILPNETWVPEFLHLWLTANYQNLRGLSEGRGGNQANLNGALLNALKVPAPNKTIQRQIAARLKAQLAEVDKARQAAEAQLRDASLLVARYREKTIKQLEDVPRVPLGELLHGIEAGKSFQTTELIACPDELGVLKVSAVSWNEFLPQEAKAVEGEYQPDERHKIKKGDLIISRANTLELVGAVVRVADDYPMRLLSDKTLRLVVNEEMVLPDYLLTVLKLPEARSHIENNATGTSDSMRNISQKTINSIPVPVLTFDQQRELINRFSQFNEEMALVQKSGKAMLNDINLLPQKILAQAFEV